MNLVMPPPPIQNFFAVLLLSALAILLTVLFNNADYYSNVSLKEFRLTKLSCTFNYIIILRVVMWL